MEALKDVPQISWMKILIPVGVLVITLVKRFGGEIQETLPVTSLTQNLARIGVITLGILVEEASKGAQDIPGLLAEPAPFVRFIPGFGDSSLNFTLICQVREFVDQYFARHELCKRIFKRFREEEVEIPFPIRRVYWRHESSNGGITTTRDYDEPAFARKSF